MKSFVWLGLVIALLGVIPVHGDGGYENKADGTMMQEVPAGSFVMGTDENTDSSAMENPRHTVQTVHYYIAKTLVTQKQFAAFVGASGYHPEGRWTADDVVGQEHHPVTLVDWKDAAAYSHWVGGRLPSEAEWEKAARGTDARLYPWGNDWDPTLCDNSADGASRGTMNVGTFPENASPYGVQDMAGNVWQWTEDWFHAYPGSHASDDSVDRYRAVRGGGWLSRDPKSFRTTYRVGRAPDISADDLGFRYVIDK